MLNSETLRALETVEHCDYETACTSLTDTGYQKIGKGTAESAVFHLRDSEYIIRIFRHEHIPAAMMAMGRAMPGNPFLPRMDEYRRLSETAYALVMEALVHPSEIRPCMNESAFRTLRGAIDAYRNFPLGDKKHVRCHEMFRRSARNQYLGVMLHALANAIAERHEDEPDCCLRLNNRTSSRVLLRRTETGFFPVFADPLTLGNDRPVALQEMKQIIERCDALLGLPSRQISFRPQPAELARPA